MTYKNCCIHAVSYLVLDVTYLKFFTALKGGERFTISSACA